jgi:hypothetical protein
MSSTLLSMAAGILLITGVYIHLHFNDYWSRQPSYYAGLIAKTNSQDRHMPKLGTQPLDGATPPIPSDLPSSWDVRGAIYTDITGDRKPEMILLVWRPWRDLPFMEWSASVSPVKEFHDANGDSCHIVVIDPHPEEGIDGKPGKSYREIWAGSAMPVPFTEIGTFDIDKDGVDELVGIEGTYETGRDGPGNRISVWKWTGFGFNSVWRSTESEYIDWSFKHEGISDFSEILSGVPF